MLLALNQLRRRSRISASIGWLTLYENQGRCRHQTTTREAVGMLRTRGWTIDPNSPPPTS
jgi:hypothetical protein